MTQAVCNIIPHSEKSVSRRAALTGAAAIAVAGHVSAAPPDPIYAAIEKYRRADEHHGHCCGLSDEEAAEAGAVSFDAMVEMAGTAPTTSAGAIALLKFIESRVIHSEQALIDFLDPREQNSILPAIITSLCSLLGRQA